EDGIRDFHVTGVQTCALPISVPVSYDRMRSPRSVSPRCAFGATIDQRSQSGELNTPRPSLLPARTYDRYMAYWMRICAFGFLAKIGRASCRERVEILVVGVDW